MITYENQENAKRAIEANRSPRYCELDRLESYAETRQYAGRDGFWTDGKPLWERAPLIAHPIVATAIESNTDLILGSSGFPAVSTGKDQSERDALLGTLIEQCGLRTVTAAVLDASQACGTGVAIFGFRNGLVFGETTRAKWCDPILDADGRVLQIEIRYAYLVSKRIIGTRYEQRVYLYRRVIDAVADTVFAPVEASINGDEPEHWTVKEKVPHGFGFCPVVWFPLRKGVESIERIDGHAIHEQALAEIEALDFALSQRHRLALYSEPTQVEIGVAPGHMATTPGRSANVPSSELGGAVTPNNPRNAEYDLSPAKQVTRKGPGYIHQYSNPDATVQYLAIPANAHIPLQDDASDLRSCISETMAVVFLNQDNLKFASAMSGKAQRMLRRRQYARCSTIRDELLQVFIRPALEMVMKIAKKRSSALKTPELVAVADTINPDDVLPTLTVGWPPYEEPDSEEESRVTTNVVNARGGPAGSAEPQITKATAIRKLSHVFGIRDAEVELAELEKERAEREQAAQESAEAAAKAKAAEKTEPTNAPE